MTETKSFHEHEVISQQLAEHIAEFMSNPLRGDHYVAGIFFHTDNNGAWKAHFFTKKRGESRPYAWEGNSSRLTQREGNISSTTHANEEVVRWDHAGEIRYQVDPRDLHVLTQIDRPALIQVNGSPRAIIETLLVKGTGPKSSLERRETLRFLQRAFNLPN